MLKWTMLAALLGVVAIGAEPERAVAQSPSILEACAKVTDTPWGKHMTGTIGRLLVLRSELGVTAEQRARIRVIVLAHRSEIAPPAHADRA